MKSPDPAEMLAVKVMTSATPLLAATSSAAFSSAAVDTLKVARLSA